MTGGPMKIEHVEPASWDGAVAAFDDLTFEQTLAYSLAAANRIGASLLLLAARQDSRIVAAGAIRVKSIPGLGRGIAWLPSGPMFCRAGERPSPPHVAAVVGKLAQYVGIESGHIFRMRCAAPSLINAADRQFADLMPGFRPTTRVASYTTAALDLRKSEEELLKALDGKWRTDLRASWKSGLELATGQGRELADRFLALFEPHRKRKGFHTEITPDFHYALAGPGYKLDTLIATRDGKDVAGIVICTAGKTATYLFGATSDAGRSSKAGYFLTWSGIRLSIGRQLSWYDLGGIDAAANPDVARFKQRMNGVSMASEPIEFKPPGLRTAIVAQLESGRLAARSVMAKWQK